MIKFEWVDKKPEPNNTHVGRYQAEIGSGVITTAHNVSYQQAKAKFVHDYKLNRKANYGVVIVSYDDNERNPNAAKRLANLRKTLSSKITEELDKNQKDRYNKWKELVNMSKSELQSYMNSEDGKNSGLSKKDASDAGISSGRESAEWIIKMKSTPVEDWTPTMWKWAGKQISFISRMSNGQGKLYDENGNRTRKLMSLLIWGHNPEK